MISLDLLSLWLRKLRCLFDAHSSRLVVIAGIEYAVCVRCGRKVALR